MIGKLADTRRFANLPGFNVLNLSDDWTPDKQSTWLREAIDHGSQILIVSPLNVTGQYREEVKMLLKMLLEHGA